MFVPVNILSEYFVSARFVRLPDVRKISLSLSPVSSPLSPSPLSPSFSSRSINLLPVLAPPFSENVSLGLFSTRITLNYYDERGFKDHITQPGSA